MSHSVPRFDSWGNETPFAASLAGATDLAEHESVADPEAFGEPESFGEGESFGEPEVFADGEAFADPESFAGAEGLGADPESFDAGFETFGAEFAAFAEPEYVDEQESPAGVRFPSGEVLRTVSGAIGRDQEHWDPVGQGLPLLDTGPSVRSKRLSRNFTVGELTTTGGRPRDVARIAPELVIALQKIRDRGGRAVTVRSGYRSWARNKEVYRARGKRPTLSRHCSGQAADIAVAGLNGTQIAKLAIDALGDGIGIGVGRDFAHIDVRGKWQLWNYGGVANWAAVERDILAYRAGRRATPDRPVAPVPRPATGGAVRAGRAELERVSVLHPHGGPPPAAIIRWNDMDRPATVDVVVHLHGYSAAAAQMRLTRSVEPISGLDFADPAGSGGGGRTRPTLYVLPRGKSAPSAKRPDRFTFPALVAPGAIAALVEEALAAFRDRTGVSASRGRLILTAHSGGGAPLDQLVRDADPDEVFVYDALYGPAGNIAEWAAQRIRRFAAAPGGQAPALRVLFGAGTAPASKALGARVCAVLRETGMQQLAPRFRVEATPVGHGDIPRRYGWRLLADAGADVGARRADCGGGAAKEAASPADEAWYPGAAATAGRSRDESWESAGFALEELEDVPAIGDTLTSENLDYASQEGADEGEDEDEDLGQGEAAWGSQAEDEGAAEAGTPWRLQREDEWVGEAEDEWAAEAEDEGSAAEDEGAGQAEDEWTAAEWAGEAESLDEGEGERGWEFASEQAWAGENEDEWTTSESEHGIAGESSSHDGSREDEWSTEGEGAWSGEDLDAEHQRRRGGSGFPSGATLAPASGATGERAEHWDPHATGLPLLDTGPRTHAVKLSPNFTVKELVTSGGHAASVARISPELVRMLQAIRDRAGRPVRIDSGYRSWARNDAVYRARGKKATLSRHCSGQAADITVRGLTGTQIAKLALEAWGPDIGVGIGAGYAHVDVRGSWAVWTYISGDAGARAIAEVQAFRKSLGGKGTGPAPAPPPAPSPVPTPGGTQTPDRLAGVVRHSAFSKCTGSAQPGARAMAAQWLRLTGRKAGIYNCRTVRGSSAPSIHGEGRAIDLYASATDATQKAQAEAYIDWIMRNAVELQVGYLIWNRRQWSWARRAAGWRPYGGVSPHTDHIHAELAWEGARTPSPLFAGGVPGLGGAPAPAPAPIPAPGPSPAPPTGKKLSPAEFVRTYGPHAKASELATGVPALVTLGQAALESGWGARAAGNNFFGIKAKATDPPTTRQLWRTREVHTTPTVAYPEVISVTPRADGKYDYVVRTWFRVYPDARAAFLAHGAVLRLPRYAKAFTMLPDAYAFATEVARGGYATAPDYASVLHSVMRTIQKAGG